MNGTISEIDVNIRSINVSGCLSKDDIYTLSTALRELPITTRSVVLLGGPDVFNTGATRDLLLTAGETAAEYAGALARLLVDSPVPTIAAMAGHAVGGGLLLGLWCDHFVLASDRLYGANFTAIGFTPGMGATAAVEDAFGLTVAREMLYTGKLLTGAELRQYGAPIPHITTRDRVNEVAIALARDVSSVNPFCTRLLRQMFSQRRRARLDAALYEEAHMQRQVFSSSDVLQCIDEYFPPNAVLE